MSEPCNGPGLGPGAGEGRGRSQSDVPRFLLGCEDDEHEMGRMEAGMKNKMYREEDMEDDEDESVSDRCSVRFAHKCSRCAVSGGDIFKSSLYVHYSSFL